MAKHSKVDGDSALAQAKARRSEEIEKLRATDPDFNDIVPQGWVAREVGFPPYFKMEPGAAFRVQVMWRDERDEFVDRETGEIRPFVRYHLKLLAPTAIECRRGPADERGESVPVQAGQIFTIGEYVQIAGELNSLMGLELALICRKSTPSLDRATGEPRKRFDFESYVSPETEKKLLSESAEDQESLRDAYREARRIALTNTFLIQAPKRAQAAAE